MPAGLTVAAAHAGDSAMAHQPPLPPVAPTPRRGTGNRSGSPGCPPAAFPDDFDVQVQFTPEMQFKIDAAVDQVERMRFEFADQATRIRPFSDVQVKIDAAMAEWPSG